MTDAATLTACMHDWLTDSASRQKAAMSGRRTIDALGGALERTLAALEPYLSPMLPARGRTGDA